MYQNSNINEANNDKAAGTYWSLLYWYFKECVLYKIAPPANTHIPTENHNPKSKPKINPATINPNAIKNPTVNAPFKKEKSALVRNTIADKPANNPKVTIPACCKTYIPPEKLMAI